MTISVITGGCGFIGSHLVELLLGSGHQVRVIDNLATGKLSNLPNYPSRAIENFELCKEDINTIDIKHNIFDGVDYIFHFAGIPSIRPSLVDPIPYMQTNVMGTVRMLEAARKAKVKKFVYAASSACYGEADVHPTPETAAIKLQHPYGLSKFQGQQAAMHWYKCFGLPVINMIMFDIYGLRADSTVIGIFLRNMAAGKPITIFGDGNQERDFVNVRDVCRAYLLAAQSDIVGEEFNVGSGNPETINKLVDLLGAERVYAPKRENEPYFHCADISKIKAQLGWEPRISFEDGIQDILDNIPA